MPAPRNGPAQGPAGVGPSRGQKALVSAAHRSSYSEELYRQVARMPWRAASLCLHAALIYICFMVPFAPARPASPFGTIDDKVEDDLSGVFRDDLRAPEDAYPDLAQDLERLPSPLLSDVAPPPTEELEAIDDEMPELPELGPADFATDLLENSFRGRGGNSLAKLRELTAGRFLWSPASTTRWSRSSTSSRSASSNDTSATGASSSARTGRWRT